jgi:phosphopantothenoylcysteine synthetase/decarboxylase
VGFALEDKNLRKNAEQKLKDKNLDMIVANTPEAIDSGKSSVQTKTAESDWIEIRNKSKKTIAKKIISLVETIMQR